MKKLIWMLAAILACGLTLTACSNSSDDNNTANDETHAKIANTR